MNQGDRFSIAAPFLCSFSFFLASQTQLFKGKFYYCDGPDVKNITTKTDCTNAHYRWVRRKYNFDNLGQVKSSLRDFLYQFLLSEHLKCIFEKGVEQLSEEASKNNVDIINQRQLWLWVGMNQVTCWCFAIRLPEVIQFLFNKSVLS